MPFAQELRVIQRFQQSVNALHLRMEHVKGTAGIERIAQAQQRIRIPDLYFCRTLGKYRMGKLRVGNAVELFRDETYQLAGENRLIILCPVIAAHCLPGLAVFPENLR